MVLFSLLLSFTPTHCASPSLVLRRRFLGLTTDLLSQDLSGVWLALPCSWASQGMLMASTGCEEIFYCWCGPFLSLTKCGGHLDAL